MGTNKPQLKTYIEKTYYDKFKIVADADGRSISNMLEQLVKKHIDNYEAEHGEIQIDNESQKCYIVTTKGKPEAATQCFMLKLIQAVTIAVVAAIFCP